MLEGGEDEHLWPTQEQMQQRRVLSVLLACLPGSPSGSKVHQDPKGAAAQTHTEEGQQETQATLGAETPLKSPSGQDFLPSCGGAASSRELLQAQPGHPHPVNERCGEGAKA